MPAKAKSHAITPPAKPALVRCAIYTRKSTEEGLEQEFNTLDAQREAAQSFIQSQKEEGWVAVPKLYDDGGYTGANMDRPALKQLLADVARGEVNCVVVYKVDRLTRSLLDFSRIMDVLDRHGATFVAVTQQFNTTSSLGRLTLNILLSFAQFERDLVSERTRDKMSAARRKGKWTGGTPVLGYDLAPRGVGLVINVEEAARVRDIYRLYLDIGSPQRVLEELNRRNWRTKSFTTRAGRKAGGVAFTKTMLHHLLTNSLYIGKVRLHGKTYPGDQPRILEDRIWKQVQRRLSRDDRRGRQHMPDQCGALLKGIIHCASCDVAMVHTYAQKKGKPLYRYYVCGKAHRWGWNHCATRSVSAPALENAVVQQLETMARSLEANEVAAALARCGASWEEMTEGEQERFLRTLVQQVRYDGRSGNVTLRFHSDAFRETDREDGAEEREEEETGNGNEPED